MTLVKLEAAVRLAAVGCLSLCAALSVTGGCASSVGSTMHLESDAASVTLIQIDGLSDAMLKDYLRDLTPSERQTSTLAKLVNAQVDEAGRVVTRDALSTANGFVLFPYIPDDRSFVLGEPRVLKASDVERSVLEAERQNGRAGAAIGYRGPTGAAFSGTGANDDARVASLIKWAKRERPGNVAVRLEQLSSALEAQGFLALKRAMQGVDKNLSRLAGESSLLDKRGRFIIVTSAFGARRTARAATIIAPRALAAATGARGVMPLGGMALLQGMEKRALEKLIRVPGVEHALWRDGPTLYVYEAELRTVRPLAARDLGPRLQSALLSITEAGDALAFLKRSGCDGAQDAEDTSCFTVEESASKTTLLVRGGISPEETLVPFILVGPHISSSPLPVEDLSVSSLISALNGDADTELDETTARVLNKVKDVQYSARHPHSAQCDASNADASDSCYQVLLAASDRVQAASIINRIASLQSFTAPEVSSLSQVSAWLAFAQSRSSLPAPLAASWPSAQPRCLATNGIVDLRAGAAHCSLVIDPSLPDNLRSILATKVADFAGAHVALLGSGAGPGLAVLSTPTLERWLGPRFITVEHGSAHSEHALVAFAAALRNYEEGSLADAAAQLEEANDLLSPAREWRDLFRGWVRKDLDPDAPQDAGPIPSWMEPIQKVHAFSLTGFDQDDDVAIAVPDRKSEFYRGGHHPSTKAEFLEALQQLNRVRFTGQEPCSFDTLRNVVTKPDVAALLKVADFFAQHGQPGFAAGAYVRLAYAEQDSTRRNELLTAAVSAMKEPSAGWARWSLGLRILRLFADEYGTAPAREYATKVLLQEAQRRLALQGNSQAYVLNTVVPMLAAGIEPERAKKALELTTFKVPPFEPVAKKLLGNYLQALPLALSLVNPYRMKQELERAIDVIDVLYPQGQLRAATTAEEAFADALYLMARAFREYMDSNGAVAQQLFAQAADVLEKHQKLFSDAKEADVVLSTVAGVAAFGGAAYLAPDVAQRKEHVHRMVGFLSEMALLSLSDDVGARNALRVQLGPYVPLVDLLVQLGMAYSKEDKAEIASVRAELATKLPKVTPSVKSSKRNAEVDNWLALLDVLARDLFVGTSSPEERETKSIRKIHGVAEAAANKLQQKWTPETRSGYYALRLLYAVQPLVLKHESIDEIADVARVAPALLQVAGALDADLRKTYPEAQLDAAIKQDPSLFQIAIAAYQAYYKAIRREKPSDADAFGHILRRETVALLGRMGSAPSKSKAMTAYWSALLSEDPEQTAQLAKVGKELAGEDSDIPPLVWDLIAERKSLMSGTREESMNKLIALTGQCIGFTADAWLASSHLHASNDDYMAAANAALTYVAQTRIQGGSGLKLNAGLESRSGEEVITVQSETPIHLLPERARDNTLQVGYGFRGTACEKDQPCNGIEETTGGVKLEWTESMSNAASRGGVLAALYFMAAGDDTAADYWLGNVADFFLGADPARTFPQQLQDLDVQFYPHASLSRDPLLPLWLATVAELRGHIALSHTYFMRAQEEAAAFNPGDFKYVREECEIDEKKSRLGEVARCYRSTLIPSALQTDDMIALLHARAVLWTDANADVGEFVRLAGNVKSPLLPPWAGAVALRVAGRDPASFSPQPPPEVWAQVTTLFGSEYVAASSHQAFLKRPCGGIRVMLSAAERQLIPIAELDELVQQCQSDALLFEASSKLAMLTASDPMRAFGLWLSAAERIRYVPLAADVSFVWLQLFSAFWQAPDADRAQAIVDLARRSNVLVGVVDAEVFLATERLLKGGDRVDLDRATLDLVNLGYGSQAAQEFVHVLVSDKDNKTMVAAARTYRDVMHSAFTTTN